MIKLTDALRKKWRDADFNGKLILYAECVRSTGFLSHRVVETLKLPGDEEQHVMLAYLTGAVDILCSLNLDLRDGKALNGQPGNCIILCADCRRPHDECKCGGGPLTILPVEEKTSPAEEKAGNTEKHRCPCTARIDAACRALAEFRGEGMSPEKAGEARHALFEAIKPCNCPQEKL